MADITGLGNLQSAGAATDTHVKFMASMATSSEAMGLSRVMATSAECIVLR